MKLNNLLNLADAEIRSCRRLTRTSVFFAIAAIASVLPMVESFLDHAELSGFLPAYGLNAPRFQLDNIVPALLFSLAVGVVTLAFDFRSRDIRERLSEVLDAKPVSNLEFVVGRFLGITTLVSAFAVVWVLLLYVAGQVCELLGTYAGESITFSSAIVLIVWDIVPNLALWCSLTMLVAVLVKYRWLTVVIIGAILWGYFQLSRRLPYEYLAGLVMYSGLDALPSELAPSVVSTEVFVNRASFLCLSAGLLSLTAFLHSRPTLDSARITAAPIGLMMLATGVLGIWWLLHANHVNQVKIDNWSALHAAHQSHTYTDIEKIVGSIEINPGRKVHLNLTITVAPSHSNNPDKWLFALNPGYKLKRVSVNDQELSEYQFEHGLLHVPQNGSGGSSARINLIAEGKPNPLFGYLDNRIDWSTMDSSERRELMRLGHETYVFHREFVVLMPGVSWLPQSGSAHGKTDWESRPQDFFDLDVEVTAPKGWTIVGPGPRESGGLDAQSRFRFNPKNPVPQVALVGSRFERRAKVVEGIEFELLLSHKHTKNLKVLDEMDDALDAWIREQVTNMRQLGFAYPYDTFSIVEVPVFLRVYGDGWKMGSVSMQPGIQMLRESAFPRARFDNALQLAHNIDNAEERGELMLAQVRDFFNNDSHGGNVLENIPRHLVHFQTAPEGDGAIAISHVVNELAAQLATGRNEYFSARMATGESGRFRGANAAVSYWRTQDSSGTTLTARVERSERFNDRPTVWQKASETSLSAINYRETPLVAYHTLLLKGNAVARGAIQYYGEEKIGKFLRTLLDRYRGQTYTKEQFEDVAAATGIDFDTVVPGWLDDTRLPGFLVTDIRVDRVTMPETQESSYQTSFLLRNSEPVAGLVEISHTDSAESQGGINPFALGDVFGSSSTSIRQWDSILVDGDTTLRVAIQSDTPPSWIEVDPYLSLNRSPIHLEVADVPESTAANVTLLPSVEEVDLTSVESGDIIVDDLDSGFSIIDEIDRDQDHRLPRWIRYMIGGDVDDRPWERELDQGLEVSFSSHWPSAAYDARWTRGVNATSHGTYRSTFAFKLADLTDSRASFSTALPADGEWQLEYHYPSLILPKVSIHKGRFSTSVGYSYTYSIGQDQPESQDTTMQIEVHNGDTVTDFVIDTQSLLSGWNVIGNVNIQQESNVDVRISDGSYDYVIADAIKWVNTETSE